MQDSDPTPRSPSGAVGTSPSPLAPSLSALPIDIKQLIVSSLQRSRARLLDRSLPRRSPGGLSGSSSVINSVWGSETPLSALSRVNWEWRTLAWPKLVETVTIKQLEKPSFQGAHLPFPGVHPTTRSPHVLASHPCLRHVLHVHFPFDRAVDDDKTFEKFSWAILPALPRLEKISGLRPKHFHRSSNPRHVQGSDIMAKRRLDHVTQTFASWTAVHLRELDVELVETELERLFESPPSALRRFTWRLPLSTTGSRATPVDPLKSLRTLATIPALEYLHLDEPWEPPQLGTGRPVSSEPYTNPDEDHRLLSPAVLELDFQFSASLTSLHLSSPYLKHDKASLAIWHFVSKFPSLTRLTLWCDHLPTDAPALALVDLEILTIVKPIALGFGTSVYGKLAARKLVRLVLDSTDRLFHAVDPASDPTLYGHLDTFISHVLTPFRTSLLVLDLYSSGTSGCYGFILETLRNRAASVLPAVQIRIDWIPGFVDSRSKDDIATVGASRRVVDPGQDNGAESTVEELRENAMFDGLALLFERLSTRHEDTMRRHDVVAAEQEWRILRRLLFHDLWLED